jgi:hypothetical protein
MVADVLKHGLTMQICDTNAALNWSHDDQLSLDMGLNMVKRQLRSPTAHSASLIRSSIKHTTVR